MKFIPSDSEFNVMIETAIHKDVISRHEYQKIMTLSGKDLTLEAYEKQLLCHLQGLMGNRPINKVQKQ